MDDETSVAAEERPGPRHLSRRTVLRTGAHLAWAVPAIQFASAAPAFAASPPGSLQITAASGTWNLANDYVNGSFRVTNNSPTHSTTGLQVTLTFPNFYVATPIPLFFNLTIYQPETLSFPNVSTGWSSPAINYSGTTSPFRPDRVGTVVFTRSGAQLAAGAFTDFVFRATTTRDVTTTSGADTIQVAATTTNGFTPGSGAINPS